MNLEKYEEFKSRIKRQVLMHLSLLGCKRRELASVNMASGRGQRNFPCKSRKGIF